MLEEIAGQTEEETGMDRAAAVAQMRFDYIEEVCQDAVIKPHESRERMRSRQIDRFLTGKYTGIPAFIGIMGLVFWLTFNVVGAFFQGLLESGITALTEMADQAMAAAHVNGAVHSLVIDGIFGGVGGVLSFLPIIVTLFFFLSLLEDSGYMARVAFIMDKLLRKLGLSGRSIVPMLVGFGCTVPGVMASRTLPSERDRKMTILLTPFMSCTAKLPIYAFFTAAFFPRSRRSGDDRPVSVRNYHGNYHGPMLMKQTAFKGEAVPFVMELPNYRMPGAKNVGHLLWDKARDFLQRAFTVIFLATIAIWFLQNFDLSFNMVADSQDSVLAAPGRRAGSSVCSGRLWRLEDRYRPDLRIHGQGERGFLPDRTVWKHSRLAERSHSAGRRGPSGILPSVYALRGGDRLGKKGAGRKMGGWPWYSDSA